MFQFIKTNVHYSSVEECINSLRVMSASVPCDIPACFLAVEEVFQGLRPNSGAKLRQTKIFIRGPSPLAPRKWRLSRVKLKRLVVSLHDISNLEKYLHLMGNMDTHFCRICGKADENSIYNLLCSCGPLATR